MLNGGAENAGVETSGSVRIWKAVIGISHESPVDRANAALIYSLIYATSLPQQAESTSMDEWEY